MRPGKADRRDERAEPHPAPVTLHGQLQQGNVVAVGPRLPVRRLLYQLNQLISAENLLELVVQPILLDLECDLSRVSGGVEVVLAQDHQDVLVNNSPGGINITTGPRPLWTS